ncbi:MAG: hypothetical protein ACYS80_21780 [Planctomycetota bacterium]|jgi:hypothetical protein
MLADNSRRQWLSTVEEGTVIQLRQRRDELAGSQPHSEAVTLDYANARSAPLIIVLCQPHDVLIAVGVSLWKGRTGT